MKKKAKNNINKMDTGMVRGRRTLDGSFCHGGVPGLSNVQANIFKMLTIEFLTPREIALRRQISLRAVQKSMKIMKEKGFLKKDFQKFAQGGLAQPPLYTGVAKSEHQVRLHRVELNVRILYKGDDYHKARNLNKVLFLDGNTVRLFPKAVEVYGQQSFYGRDASAATADAMAYFKQFLIKLENRLKVVLIKPGVENIRIVRSEYAEVDNELSRDMASKGEKLRIRAPEDGRIWLEIDNSFKLNELETKHPVTAKADMDKVKAVFDDVRTHELPLHSVMVELVHQGLISQKDTTIQVHAIAVQINSLAVGLNSMLGILKALVPEPPQKGQEAETVEERPFYLG